jgi:hypothetical protein
MALAEVLQTASKAITTPDVTLSLALKLPHVDAGQGRRGAMSTVLDAYPEYGTTSRLDELRATQYAYLDKQDHV